jgi:CheY-like chemotaxis protein
VRDLEGRIVGASKISRDITARKRDEEALREADRRKDEFLAVLAHELRNPLAPIRSSLDLLRMDDTGEHALKARTIIERQVGHMVRLVDDLLEVSRISQGKIELRSEPVDVSAVILSAIETSRPAVEAGKHRLSMTLPTESLAVKGDFVRLGQVVANLLNNAARYTSSAGTISVSAERDDGHAVIAVRDSGVGIEPGMLPRIFEMFVQIERPGHRAKGGLGIGLSLARNLVKLHGGEISARSDGLGKGSTFEVRLPLISSAVPKTANEVPPDCEKARHSVKRVLVVDDNVDAAQSLGMMLVAMGHQVRVEHAGTAALEAARAEAPDVALLDIGMPEMDGLELARRLRREPGLQNVRLAAVTGFGGQEDVARSKAAGFDEHLVKPVSPDVLRLVVER